MSSIPSQPTSGFPTAFEAAAMPAAETSSAVVVFSPEQARAAWIELRDDRGEIVGYLARHEGTSHFFTPEQLEAIRQRAAKPPTGAKTFAEVYEAVRQRMEGSANSTAC